MQALGWQQLNQMQSNQQTARGGSLSLSTFLPKFGTSCSVLIPISKTRGLPQPYPLFLKKLQTLLSCPTSPSFPLLAGFLSDWLIFLTLPMPLLHMDFPKNILVSDILNFSHSPLWKQAHNSFIYSPMSATSVTKLPFPFYRIPIASFASYSLST